MANSSCPNLLTDAFGRPTQLSDFNCDYSAIESLNFPGHQQGFDYANLSTVCNLEQATNATDFTDPTSKLRALTSGRKLCAWLGSVLILINIGTKTSFKECTSNFKRPVGIVVGFLCQFTVMPMLALAIIYLFQDQLSKHQRLGIFCCGCAPGGTLSNFVVGCVKGDINLSVAMTITSQVASLFMIPLWLKIYESFSAVLEMERMGGQRSRLVDSVLVVDEDGVPVDYDEAYPVDLGAAAVKSVPVFSVIQALCSCLASLFIGYYAIRKGKKTMLKIRGGLALVGFCLTLTAMLLAFLSEKSMVKQGWRLFSAVLPLTMMMPVSGIVLGYVFGYLAYKMVYNDFVKNFGCEGVERVTWKSPCLRTIGIETGVQNIVIPSLLFNLNFHCPTVLIELMAVTISFCLTQYVTIMGVIFCGKIFCEPEVDVPILVPETSDSDLRSEEASQEKVKLNL